MTPGWRQVSTEPLPEVGYTDASVFEALFVRGLDCPIELKVALSGIGVDLENLLAKYPSPVWIASIDLARSYLYAASTSNEAAERELGRKFFAGFVRTITGRLLDAVLPFMTARRLLLRLPRYVRMGREDVFIETEEDADTRLRVLVVDPANARPWFFAGMIEAALDRLREPYRLEIKEVDLWRFEVFVTWTG